MDRIKANLRLVRGTGLTDIAGTITLDFHCARGAGRHGDDMNQEVLKRWPEWEVDHDAAVMARTSTVRGWKTLPASV